ncbi:RimJ/RimL family protein N-acetyltransferase [Rhodobium orientis]|uniref:N-acetyltransferase domain-containing protein n=1 Tax=Rhodobium orientis TaxID=34017 RepID=A0A327JJS8_9HYPH|nr:GNAT family N-acetyltransferase [Rhodobium orientis]MBB4305235.1 RimJ/RimL family protein N-acetyltransferase [Rhodobium orientis]MBK5952137.1 hypothetical protein [Rhodobium orientis]RAI26311.1 hypothetical protein CH339_14540 [Rhodobium orientis]
MTIPELSTERLRFRQWRNEDLAPFAAFYADPAASRFIGGPSNREAVWRRIASYVGHWTLRGYGLWALEDKATGRFAGYCGLWYPDGWPEPEIGWGLMKQFQGRGLITEAALRVRAYAYDVLGWQTAASCIADDNGPSRRVAARLGARPERNIIILGNVATLYRHPAPEQSGQS